jgi:hypothetical protein
MSIQRGHDDIAPRGAYVRQLGNEGMALDAEDGLDSLFADFRYRPARLRRTTYSRVAS